MGPSQEWPGPAISLKYPLPAEASGSFMGSGHSVQVLASLQELVPGASGVGVSQGVSPSWGATEDPSLQQGFPCFPHGLVTMLSHSVEVLTLQS